MTKTSRNLSPQLTSTPLHYHDPGLAIVPLCPSFGTRYLYLNPRSICSILLPFSRRMQGAKRHPSIVRIQGLFYFCDVLPNFGNRDALIVFTAEPSHD
ncbi:uncharacterized protein Bfra_002878 [Botrytis fragariae]|uniref:Uncharacterized protein n=1 Tax=Botrytis fragariae TaxID=1964551 RepID=A0A8H6AZ62_9HELO|nr:uncharacterized protein Bfra_002878 [Botrytis fragariae]KAF5876473.1 hypothetical protein Bfra_002878 [Botrytis fragariae]